MSRGVRVRCLLRAALAMAAGLLTVPATAGPALAHGGEAPAGSNYRAQVTAVEPPRAGLTVRTIEAGARLELTNHTGRRVLVLGYSGEPYLRVDPDGVWENTNSPATYLNQTLAGDVEPPSTATPNAEPSWRKVGDEPVARWHDQRAQWREETLPPQVIADPHHEHRVRDWTVPLRVDDADGLVRGTVDRLPPPDPYVWWVGVLLGVLVVGALGLLTARTRAGAHALTALAAGTALGGLAAVAFAVARQLDTGDRGADLLLGLLTGSTWTFLTGLGALAAGAYALLRRPGADFAVTLAGGCVALFAGAANAMVFSRAVVPVIWPATTARIAVALIVVLGAGSAAAGALRLHASARVPHRVGQPPVSTSQ